MKLRILSSILILSVLLGTIAFLLLHAQTSQAAAHGKTYYVAPSGRDSNSGTRSAPFATLSHAASVVHAGDTVDMRGGVYTLSNGVLLASYGSKTAPITFQSAPGEHAILAAGPGSAKASCLVVMGQYLIVKNLECRGPWFQGILAWQAQHDQLLNNTIHGTTAYGMLIASDKLGASGNILVQGNVIYQNGGVSNGTGGLDTTYVHDVTLVHNTVYSNRGLGFDFNGCTHLIARNNVLHDNTGIEINLNNVAESTLDGNFVYEAGNAASHANGKLPSGIQLANATDIGSVPLNHLTIINNIVVGTDTDFFYGNYGAGGGMKNTLVANNTFYGAHGFVVYIEPSAGHSAVFVNNIFVQTHTGWAGDIPHNSGLTFQHNSWYGGDATGGASATDIHANPGFVHPGGLSAECYRVQSTSPERKHGVHVGAVTHDFAGAARPTKGSITLGAYQ